MLDFRHGSLADICAAKVHVGFSPPKADIGRCKNDVRFGSLADISAYPSDVRFPPEADIKPLFATCRTWCPLWCQKHPLWPR